MLKYLKKGRFCNKLYFFCVLKKQGFTARFNLIRLITERRNQMKITFSFLISIFCCLFVYSQQSPVPQDLGGGNSRLICSDTARYQIILFNQGALTVKLDRYTGRTYQYSNERRRWYLLEVRGGLPSGAANSAPKYRIYEAEQLYFLLNEETGQTWVFNIRTWEPVVD